MEIRPQNRPNLSFTNRAKPARVSSYALYVLMGCLYTVIGIPMIIFGNDSLSLVEIFYLLGPIWMGVLGFICFVIFSAVYNALAHVFGSFEIEVKDIGGAS